MEQLKNRIYKTKVPYWNFVLPELVFGGIFFFTRIKIILLFNVLFALAFLFDYQYLIFYSDHVNIYPKFFKKVIKIEYLNITEVLLYKKRGLYDSVKKARLKTAESSYVFYYWSDADWEKLVSFFNEKGIRLVDK